MFVEFHDCTLPGHGTFEERVLPIYPEDGLWAKFMRRIKLFITVSPAVRNTRVLRTRQLQILAATKHLLSRECYIIHPNSLFRHYWNLIMLVSYIMVSMTIPLCLLHPSGIYYAHYVQLVLDVIFCIDIILNFMSGYVDEESYEVILDPKIIRTTYLKFYFFIDIITSVPGISLLGEPISISLTFQMLKFLKLFRAKTMIVLIRSTLFDIGIEYRYIDLITTFVHTFAILPWLTCIFVVADYFLVVIDPEINYAEDYYLEEDFNGGTKIIAEILLVFLRTVLCQPMLRPNTVSSAFIGSMSRIICYINYAYMSMMILNFLITEYYVGSKFISLMAELQEYMTTKSVPMNVQNKLITYYSYKFQDKFFNEDVLMSLLSRNLQTDVKLTFCRKVVGKMELFQGLPGYIVDMLMTQMIPVIYLPNDYVIRAGTKSDCMYFIINGTVSILTPNGKELRHLEDGSFFGEVALLTRDARRMAHVIAIEYCELFRLDSKDFRECALECVELAHRVRNIAIARTDETQIAEEEHLTQLRSASKKWRSDSTSKP